MEIRAGSAALHGCGHDEGTYASAVAITSLVFPTETRRARRPHGHLTRASLITQVFVFNGTPVECPPCLRGDHFPYSSCRRNQILVSFRPLGARSSHWYIPHMASGP